MDGPLLMYTNFMDNISYQYEMYLIQRFSLVRKSLKFANVIVWNWYDFTFNKSNTRQRSARKIQLLNARGSSSFFNFLLIVIHTSCTASLASAWFPERLHAKLMSCGWKNMTKHSKAFLFPLCASRTSRSCCAWCIYRSLLFVVMLKTNEVSLGFKNSKLFHHIKISRLIWICFSNI